MGRVREAPATIKILLIAIVLILLPGAVLSYVSYISVNERARRLEAGYRGTLYLVRDKIELEVLRLEQGLRVSLSGAVTELNGLSAARHLLSLATANRPWLRHPFLAGPAAAREDPIAQVALEQAQDLRLAFSALVLLTNLLALERTEREQPQGNGGEQDNPAEKSDPARPSMHAPEVTHRHHSSTWDVPGSSTRGQVRVKRL
jgi:hypothetical protein